MKIKRVAIWFSINSILAACLILGIFYEIKGAENVAIFMCWLLFFGSFFLHTEVADKKIKEKGRSVPVWINFPFDLAVLLLLIWFNFWTTSIIWAAHILVSEAAFAKSLSGEGAIKK